MVLSIMILIRDILVVIFKIYTYETAMYALLSKVYNMNEL